MFRRVKAGLHRAEVAGEVYELHRDPHGKYGHHRQWALHRITGDEHAALDTLDSSIGTIAEGKNTLEFILRVEAYLRELGATKGGFYKWELQTRLGPLHISPYGNRVMMRFGNVDKAKTELGDRLFNHTGFNRHSGKWNMHWFSDAESAEVQMLSFKNQLDSVM